MENIHTCAISNDYRLWQSLKGIYRLWNNDYNAPFGVLLFIHNWSLTSSFSCEKRLETIASELCTRGIRLQAMLWRKTPNKRLNHTNMPLSGEILECVWYLRGCELTAVAVRTCVYRLAVMFVWVMSLCHLWKDWVRLHLFTVSQPVWVFGE